MSSDDDDDDLFGDVRKQLRAKKALLTTGSQETAVTEPSSTPCSANAVEKKEVPLLNSSSTEAASSERAPRRCGRQKKEEPAKKGAGPVLAPPSKLSRKGGAIMKKIQSLRKQAGGAEDPRFLKYTEGRTTRSKKRNWRNVTSTSDSSLLDSSWASSSSSATQCESADNDLCSVFVRYEGSLLKYSIKWQDPLSKIVSFLHEDKQAPPSQVVLWRGKEFEGLRLEDPTTQTPQGLKWDEAQDYLSACVYENGGVPSGRCIEIRFLGESDRRCGAFSVDVSAFEPLMVGLEKYCQAKGITDKSKIALTFDGERVDPLQTPHDVGMDDGDILDVAIGTTPANVSIQPVGYYEAPEYMQDSDDDGEFPVMLN